MCRLLGIVSSESTEFRMILKESPRSMASLSHEHSDGWGIAIHDEEAKTWHVNKGVERASDDAAFQELAVGSRGELLVAHIRKRTVGHTSLENTHPFQQGRWIFAHNGTIKDVAWLRDQTSPARASEIRGQTDSELFFAYLLTALDAAAAGERDRALAAATREARNRPDFGSFNFLLSDGVVLYAHRFGRTLFLLERSPHDAVRHRRASQDGSVVETPWSQRRHAMFVASERMTDEPWNEVGERSLLRIDSVPTPRWRLLA
jgi:predicted glutamine amidotransferase